MALFSHKTLKSKHNLDEQAYNRLFEQAKNETVDIRDVHTEFDIFLSHSYKDKDIIPYIKKELEDMGYSVYVDWITDNFLSRREITKKTAKVLQKRMQQSQCMFFATSENSPSSKWMPWELGYFDGIKNKKVAILPIKTDNNKFDEDFKGQEYLSLYYYVSIDKLSREIEHTIWAMEKSAFQNMVAKWNTINKLFINENNSKFVLFKQWINGENPYSMEDEHNKIMKEFNKRS